MSAFKLNALCDLHKHVSKNITIFGDECMMWSDIFEDWPKAELNNGTRTYEFLPSFETFKNATNQYQIPVSLYNVTYITWEDNRSCDKFIRHSGSYIICDICDI